MPDKPISIYLCYHELDFPQDTIHKKSWIEVFKDTLKILFVQSGHARPLIYDSNSKEDCSACQVCVVVPSESFVLDEGCIETIRNLSKEKEPAMGLGISIYQVMPKYIAPAHEIEALRVIPKYDFFEYDPETGLYQEFKNRQRLIDYRYWLKLDDLVYDLISHTLRREATKKKAVYLTNCTMDSNTDYEEIKRSLKHWGYHVIPDRPYEVSSVDLEALIQEQLSKSQLIVQILGERYGEAVNASGSSLSALENDLAAKHIGLDQGERLVWLPKNIEVVESKQQAYIEYVKSHREMRKNTEYLETSFEHFKGYLRRKLDLLEKPKKNIEKQYIFGITSSANTDWSYIEHWAHGQGWRFYTFDTQSDWFMTQSLIGNATAIILAPEGAKKTWVSYWKYALIKASGYRERVGEARLFWLKNTSQIPPPLSKNIYEVNTLEDVTALLSS